MNAATLDVVATGAVTQTAAGITVAGAASVDANGNPITLTDADNDFQGPVSLDGTAVEIADANSLQLDLVNATTLDVVATGAVTQTAAGITVTGAASVDANGNPITLTDPDNDFQGPVSLDGTAVEITDANGLQLDLVNATTLDVVATGAVTQTAAGITVAGVASVDANGNPITLTDADNDFQGPVSLDGTAVEITDANGLQLDLVNATTLDVVATGR